MKIALVEDSAEQSERIALMLEDAGYSCTCFAKGTDLRHAVREQSFDLLLLDWRLPDISGIELLQWVRQVLGQRLPVLFITSNVADDDIVSALGAGADDYLTKPVRANVLLARIRALLRRAYPEASQASQVIRVGPYLLDPAKQSIDVGNVRVSVTACEFYLALYLFRNLGRMVPRESLEKAVWGRSIGTDSRTVTTHLSRLRVKLGLRPENGVRLTSVYSLGYRLERLDPEIDRTFDGPLQIASIASAIG